MKYFKDKIYLFQKDSSLDSATPNFVNFLYRKNSPVKDPRRKLATDKDFATDARIRKSAFCGAPKKRRQKDFALASTKKSWYDLINRSRLYLYMTFYSTKRQGFCHRSTDDYMT